MSDRRTTVDLMLSVIRLLRDGEHSVASLAKATQARRHVIAGYVEALVAHDLIEETGRRQSAVRPVFTYRWKKVP